jgi:alkylhydroperoxidase family enzyme
MPGMTSASLLLAAAVMLLCATMAAVPVRGEESPFPLPTDDECWRKLPPAEKGGGQALPSWARALAISMPRTTAMLLRLDNVHRTRGPLDPKLRSQMRWVAAHANRCDYAEAYALADAKRAGVDNDTLDALKRGDHSRRPAAEKIALEFARKMAVDSAGVTDAEFAELVTAYGERRTAAMVLAMAYANFQDRLLSCLGSPLEEGGPQPPLEVQFAPDAAETKAKRPLATQVSPLPEPTGKDLIEDEPDWTSISFDALQARLETQRRKPTRLPVPAWAEVERGLPPGFMQPSRIVWNQVCLGYVPELATAWEALMRTNMAEMRSKVDRVFAISLFWIVTRTIDCPYCMGHCEMNWEVAGLPKSLIAQRSALLAGDDWSSFPPAEQRAFAFARKLTRYPGRISPEDVETVKHDFGAERALFVLMYASRCNYMTRISNGLQLTLERDNVFFDYYSDEPDGSRQGAAHASKGARVPLLADALAWKRLPPVESVGGQPLPSWARALAGPLPYTTAAMLELDRAYRASDSLDPKLAAAIRLVVARTVRSEYGIACAQADLKRLGLDQPAIDRFSGEDSSPAGPDHAALAFAKRMTTAGYASTDAELGALVQAFGEAKVVAIVLQTAYANFLYRMTQAFGLAVEPGGPLPPLDVRFTRRAGEAAVGSDVPAAPRPVPAVHATSPSEPNAKLTDADWLRFGFDDLQARLEAQRERTPRVSIPTWEEFRKVLPASLYPRDRPLKIRWSLLVSGRQPVLGPAWIKTTRTFGSESKQDRVFEESLFWVVTRSLRCFYCMGHCEMLLEVAGLGKDDIRQRTARLAGGDWSGFPPAERAAFAFARKLTDTPWEVDDADVRNLVDRFGLERAIDVIWWSSRCQFMTKISDAFQLQLERENVFADFQPQASQTK